MRVHTTYNKQHTYTQHLHRTQMICTSYHHAPVTWQHPFTEQQWEGQKWTVDVNPVNSEQTCILLLTLDSKYRAIIVGVSISWEALLQSSYHESTVTHSPSQVTITANVSKLFAISCHYLSYYISVYICYRTTPKMWSDLTHAYRTVIPRQGDMLYCRMI